MTKTLFFSVPQPSLPQLLHLKVHLEVGADYFTFGIFLLNDQTGNRIRNFERECQGNPEGVMLRILQEWLEGKGLPVTWESLVQTLRDIDLAVLADKIQALKIPAGGKRGQGRYMYIADFLNLHLYQGRTKYYLAFKQAVQYTCTWSSVWSSIWYPCNW